MTTTPLSDCGYPTGVVATSDGLGVSVHVDGLTPDDCRHLAGRLTHLADSLTPASAKGLYALHVALTAINEASGSAHTLGTLAAACGTSLLEVTEADAERMAVYIGGTLMRA